MGLSSTLWIIIRTIGSCFYQPFCDFTVSVHKCVCVCRFGCLFLFVLDGVWCCIFWKRALQRIKISEVHWDSVFTVCYLHVYKSKRTKPCILLSKLIEISRLILWTTLYVYSNVVHFPAATCVVKQARQWCLSNLSSIEKLKIS